MLQAGGGPVLRSNQKRIVKKVSKSPGNEIEEDRDSAFDDFYNEYQKRIVKKVSKSPGIPTLICQVNQPTDDEPLETPSPVPTSTSGMTMSLPLPIKYAKAGK